MTETKTPDTAAVDDFEQEGIPQELLEALREDAPSTAAQARIMAALGALPAPPLAPSAPAHTSPAAASTGLRRTLATAGTLVLVVAAWFGWRALSPQPTSPDPVAEQSAPDGHPPAPVEMPSMGATGTEVEPAENHASPAAEEPVAEEPILEPVVPNAPEEPPETSRTPARHTQSAPRERPSEASLITAARRVVATAPRRALRTLREHARIYPDGALRQEREALQIEAWWHRGHHARARSALTRFESRYPDSAHVYRLRRIAGAP